jgi:cell division protein FtsN
MREDTYQVSVNKAEGRLGVLGTLGWARSTGATVSLQLRMSMGRDPVSGHGFVQAAPLANNGAVSARTFLDSNNNGRLDPGEPVLDGAVLQIDGGARPGPLGERAPLFQTGLHTNDYVAVTVDPSGMEDPFLNPAQPGVRILPRPGKVAVVDIPMVVSGEITGVARIKGTRGTRDLAGLALELLDEAGHRAVAVRSSFDGFFEMHDLPPGRYLLRVLPEEAERLGVSLPPPRALEIKPKGSIHDGIVMRVELLAPEPDVPLFSRLRQAAAPTLAQIPRSLPPASQIPLATAPVAKPAPAPAAAQAPLNADGRCWSLQFGLFFDAANLAARKQALSTHFDGLCAEPCQDAKHGLGYRLLLGRYASRREALDALRRLHPASRHPQDRPVLVELHDLAEDRRTAANLAQAAPLLQASLAPPPPTQPVPPAATAAGPAQAPAAATNAPVGPAQVARLAQARTAEAADGRSWSLQFGVFFNAANLTARKQALAARFDGLRVVPFQDIAHGLGYRLLLGRYASRFEAQEALRRLHPEFQHAQDRPIPVDLRNLAGSWLTALPPAPPAPAPEPRAVKHQSFVRAAAPVSSRHPWTLQMGAFSEPENLARLQEEIGAWAEDLSVAPCKRPLQGRGCLLLMGRYPSREAAYRAIQRLPERYRQPSNRPFPVILPPEASPWRLPCPTSP